MATQDVPDGVCEEVEGGRPGAEEGAPPPVVVLIAELHTQGTL